MSGIIKIEGTDDCTGIHSFSAPEPIIAGDQYEWRIAEQPFGAGATLSATDTPTVQLDAPVAGCYTLSLVITRASGSVPVVEPAPPVYLGCPEGVFAGESIDVYYECSDGGSISNVIVTGPATGYVIAGNVISISTDSVFNGGQLGSVLLQVECTDALGNVTEANCSTQVHDPANQNISWQSSETTCADVVLCETACIECEDVFCFSNCEPICEEGVFNGASQDCPPIVEPEAKFVPVPLTQQFLTPSKQIVAPNLGDPILDCCEGDELFYEFKHAPSFCWNNICGCPGWVTEGAGLFGTSAADACCGSGRPWIFEGTGVMSASGPTARASCIVIWGHNIATGTVQSTPTIDIDPVAQIGLCSDDACVAPFTRPIVLNVTGTDTTNIQLQISGTTVDGGPIRIQHIFFGDKFFLEDDSLPGGFTNPHNGSDFYTRVTENECGQVIRREVVRQRKTLSLDLSCLSEAWLATRWRAYLRYLQAGNPVYFQWSRNGYPDDIFMGDLTSVNGGSTYRKFTQSLQFTIEGYCSQPQAKALA